MIGVFGKQLAVRFRRKFDILLQFIYNYTVTGNMDKVNAWKNENYVVDEKFKTPIAAIPLL